MFPLPGGDLTDPSEVDLLRVWLGFLEGGGGSFTLGLAGEGPFGCSATLAVSSLTLPLSFSFSSSLTVSSLGTSVARMCR